MDKKTQTTIEFCSFCEKEYKAEIWTKIGSINLTKMHNCKEQKKFYALKKKLA